MLNTLVNSTDAGLCNKNSNVVDSRIDEIFECIGMVQCQTNLNTECLEQIHNCVSTTDISATNVSAESICTNSICTNALSTAGIEATSIQSQCLNVEGKATVGSIESNGLVKAESVQTQSISTENITGLQSLTVEGGVWADCVRADALEVNGKTQAECIETDEMTSDVLKSNSISASEVGANTVVSDCFMGTNATLQKACVGSLSTSCFSSDEIATSKINSTSLSVPKLETSGGITGKGTIDTTSPVWKEIRIPLFTGMVQFYTDEWKVTINGGREFIWEDESLDHLKFLSNDGETVTVAVDWDGDVYYTYNVAKEEPVLSLVDNTGVTPSNDHTYIMQDSGVKRGTVLIYQDKEFTNQGLTILGKVKASNLEITCGESIDCLSVGNLCVSNSIRSDNPIEVDICARNFCISSPCTYINNCLYADHLETNCICNDGYLWTDRLYFDSIQVVNCAEKPKQVVVYKDGLLCDSYNVCVDDDTVYSPKVCITGNTPSGSGFYGNLHGTADNSCCFEGRNFCKACLDILSGKAKLAGIADCAMKVCIGYCWAEGDEPEYGYIPFVDPYSGCIFRARLDPGYSNPIAAYNEWGLVCLDMRGCLCVRDFPLFVSDYIYSEGAHIENYLTVDREIKTDRLCSCVAFTGRLCVCDCAKFHGPVYFYDNIYQCGASYCTHAQNIYTCSDTITMREGADFAGEAQIKVLKYDGTNDGVIQLGTDGTLRIGDETNCQPVLTRSEEGSICDGHVLVWDATNRCAKDGGDAIVTCEYVHCVGKDCKTASCNYACIVAKCCDYYNRQYTDQMDRLCYNCLDKKVCEACINSYKHADTVGSCCYQRACSCAINMDKICLACAYACSDSVDSNACAFAVSCGHLIGTSCKNAACTFASACGHLIGTSCKNTACTFASACGHLIGTSCKNAACSFAVSCGHLIGTACKNAATSTKANCYGNNYNCVACSNRARYVELGNYTGAEKRFIYFGQPDNTTATIGCNPNLTFCPTCNIIAMGSACGSALCLVGTGSCCMSGDGTKLNPKVVFSAIDGQNGCLQYSQYDAVHPGAGLCWATNTTNTWFQTDCVYANRYFDSNGCQIGGYCATIASPGGTTRYVLLDLGTCEAVVNFGVYTNTGTIVKSVSANTPEGTVHQATDYGITGYYQFGINRCFWLRIANWRPINLWGPAPIRIVSNTTTDPGCAWNSPVILPTCTYVSTVGTQCKTAACSFASSCGHLIGTSCKNTACSFAVSCGHSIGTSCKNAACTFATSVGTECKSATCTYATSVGTQCRNAACTYANTVAFCNVNTCKGIGVMGVARGIDAQCWTKAGYWAYMTTKDGPNCCWNHVIKTDWSAGTDVWASGISIPTYNAPQNGIHYKVRCCNGTTGWTLVPDISCTQNLGLACRNIAEACACTFAASCAQAVVPETSTFAKCYGNATNCVAYANQVRVGASNTNAYFKIPFTGTTGTTASNQGLYVDSANAYPSYNPSTNVFCGYTVCVAQTLAVRNANGGFRLGAYCIYIA